MNCFGPKRFPLLLACYVDGKAGYAFKVKDAVTKKEITINNSHF
jgi:hypothetical protein